MEDARNTILKEVLRDFQGRGLIADDLRRPYEGFPTKKLKQVCVQHGINDVDYDLAFKELEKDGLIGSGPMDVADPPKISGVLILPWVYSKREYVYMKEKGYKEASKKPSQRTGRSMPPAVVHGDQFINYGQAGAMGARSVGTINHQQQWKAVQNQIDLPTLAAELERLRAEYQKVASSRDDAKQLVLLGDAAEEAERGNGDGVMANLSRIGANVLKVAKDIGTDIAAKVIVESTKG